MSDPRDEDEGYAPIAEGYAALGQEEGEQEDGKGPEDRLEGLDLGLENALLKEVDADGELSIQERLALKQLDVQMSFLMADYEATVNASRDRDQDPDNLGEGWRDWGEKCDRTLQSIISTTNLPSSSSSSSSSTTISATSTAAPEVRESKASSPAIVSSSGSSSIVVDNSKEKTELIASAMKNISLRPPTWAQGQELSTEQLLARLSKLEQQQ